jgi:hypothetical protein
LRAKGAVGAEDVCVGEEMSEQAASAAAAMASGKALLTNDMGILQNGGGITLMERRTDGKR